MRSHQGLSEAQSAVAGDPDSRRKASLARSDVHLLGYNISGTGLDFWLLLQAFRNRDQFFIDGTVNVDCLREGNSDDL